MTLTPGGANKLHYSMRVSDVAGRKPPPDGKTKPDHWVDNIGSAFQNPWPSFRKPWLKDMLTMLYEIWRFPSVNKETCTLIPFRKPTWGIGANDEEDTSEKIKATWLGHACFLLELPSRSDPGVRGVRILFDPVFSERCSPSQWLGPKRYTPAPCKIEEIPEIDAVIISVNSHTIRLLSNRTRTPHFFAPLGNGHFFENHGVPKKNIHIMDWWDTKRLEVPDLFGQEAQNQTAVVDVTCTPCQHLTGRRVIDNCKSLWASWVIEEVRSPSHPQQVEDVSLRNMDPPAKVFFGGDTGYRCVSDGQDEDKVPVCPVFKEIGQKFGGFDFAMIPIGAYMPRHIMSSVHCAPQDSVRLFKDIMAKRAVGMHWGAWVLTTEDVLEPPRKLAEECKNIGMEDGVFGVCGIGETLFI
ncbi:N-acyl-phosphatidylethanolamine-hydrolyzing phospholipase D [Tricholoma matsutake]|nr:N-acyl-phosphatidylethanolamine-hydrolyzing phospholipase D [Tricholoma matsutake 945]